MEHARDSTAVSSGTLRTGSGKGFGGAFQALHEGIHPFAVQGTCVVRRGIQLRMSLDDGHECRRENACITCGMLAAGDGVILRGRVLVVIMVMRLACEVHERMRLFRRWGQRDAGSRKGQGLPAKAAYLDKHDQAAKHIAAQCSPGARESVDVPPCFTRLVFRAAVPRQGDWRPRTTPLKLLAEICIFSEGKLLRSRIER